MKANSFLILKVDKHKQTLNYIDIIRYVRGKNIVLETGERKEEERIG